MALTKGHPRDADVENPVLIFDRDTKLANVAEVPVVWNDVEFPTAEKAYHAAKFNWDTDWDIVQEIMVADDSEITFDSDETGPLYGAKGIAYANFHRYRDDWEQEKLRTMIEIVYTKFTSNGRKNRKAKKTLMSTGRRYIAEYSPTHFDNRWGVIRGGTGEFEGKNCMGRILMYVRERIRREEGESDA